MYKLKIESYTHSYSLDKWQSQTVVQALERAAKTAMFPEDKELLIELSKGIWMGRKDYQDDKSH